MWDGGLHVCVYSDGTQLKNICGSVVGPRLANPFEYRQLVGALMFLVNSRFNICFAVNTLSQFMVEPHHIHWIVAKNLLRYLRRTIWIVRAHLGVASLWVCFNILDEQEAEIGCFKHRRGRIHCCEYGLL